MKRILIFFLFVAVISAQAQRNKSLLVSSPDGSIIVSVEAGTKLEWSVKQLETE